LDIEFVTGIVRLALPLFALCLAAVCFDRVGVVHIGLDGQVGLASAAYVGVTQAASGQMAIVAAFGIALVSSIGLAEATKRFKLDGFLVGLALLYLGYGCAQGISQFVSGTPGYLLLGNGQIGERTPFWILIILIILVWFLIEMVRVVRLTKIISESVSLAELEGVSVLLWSYAYAFAASLLVAVAAIFLSELGGSYTTGIAAERGFLALAFVAVARYRIGLALVLSILYATLQKFGYQGIFPIELVESASFAIAIALVVWSGARSRIGASQ